MHHSRLTAIGIDVPPEVHDQTARLWADAFGASIDDSDDTYRSAGKPRGVMLFVQRLGTGGARVHLDIETDSIDAEVARLEAIGASRVEQVDSWWVMRNPAGSPVLGGAAAVEGLPARRCGVAATVITGPRCRSPLTVVMGRLS